MTTPRIRRNKTQQAQDVLRALLKEQDIKADKLSAELEVAQREADKTRRALESLGMEPLPGTEQRPGWEVVYNMPSVLPPQSGMETVKEVTSIKLDGKIYLPNKQPVGVGSNGDDADSEELATASDIPASRPHRQRIGEKAEVDDVWPNSGRSSSGELSPLMESRKAKCNLCLGGLPFATQAKTEHYVVERDDQGVEKGFEYQPCKGI